MDANPPFYSPEDGYHDPSITIPAQRLARLFESRFAGYGGYRLRAAGSKVTQMLLDEGLTEAVLVAEIMNPQRPRDQKLWDFPAWVRARMAEVAETTTPDGEVKPFDATWAAFRSEFRARYMARDAESAILNDWKEDCRRRLGEDTTLDELRAALLEFSTDPRRSEPPHASMFWPRNAWAYLREKIMSRRKHKPTTIRLTERGQPPPPLPEGYSLFEAARRVREAKLSDPTAPAEEVIARYKRELESR